MNYNSLKKIHEGKYITRYDLNYKAKDGQTKIYEMISRNPDMKDINDIRNPHADAVVLIITDESHKKILVDREFRPAAGSWVYNFPAGLIDPGETPQESAARELQEETGLELVVIEDVIRESYSAIGFSNEKNVCIAGTARGEFKESSSVYEEIKPAWYTRAEIRKMLQEETFTARTQAYLYLWSRQEEK